jgi:hypothetical protein
VDCFAVYDDVHFMEGEGVVSSLGGGQIEGQEGVMLVPELFKGSSFNTLGV